MSTSNTSTSYTHCTLGAGLILFREIDTQKVIDNVNLYICVNVQAIYTCFKLPPTYIYIYMRCFKLLSYIYTGISIPISGVLSRFRHIFAKEPIYCCFKLLSCLAYQRTCHIYVWLENNFVLSISQILIAFWSTKLQKKIKKSPRSISINLFFKNEALREDIF